MTEYRVGQTWRDKRAKPSSTFTVLRLRTRKYADGDEALRVKGVLVTGVGGIGTHLRDLDSRSAAKMFPYITFDPPREHEETPK